MPAPDGSTKPTSQMMMLLMANQTLNENNGNFMKAQCDFVMMQTEIVKFHKQALAFLMDADKQMGVVVGALEGLSKALPNMYKMALDYQEKDKLVQKVLDANGMVAISQLEIIRVQRDLVAVIMTALQQVVDKEKTQSSHDAQLRKMQEQIDTTNRLLHTSEDRCAKLEKFLESIMLSLRHSGQLDDMQAEWESIQNNPPLVPGASSSDSSSTMTTTSTTHSSSCSQLTDGMGDDMSVKTAAAAAIPSSDSLVSTAINNNEDDGALLLSTSTSSVVDSIAKTVAVEQQEVAAAAATEQQDHLPATLLSAVDPATTTVDHTAMLTQRVADIEHTLRQMTDRYDQTMRCLTDKLARATERLDMIEGMTQEEKEKFLDCGDACNCSMYRDGKTPKEVGDTIGDQRGSFGMAQLATRNTLIE